MPRQVPRARQAPRGEADTADHLGRSTGSGPPRNPLFILVGGFVALIVAAVVLNMGIGSPNQYTIGSPLLNKPAPDFDLVSTTGEHVTLASLRGRPVIVNFWASWCLPCREEFPQFAAARAAHASEGLEILGIVHQDSSDAATAFAQQQAATWPLLMDPQDSAWSAYLGVGVPSTYFIDRQGVVRATSLGPVTPTALPGQLAMIL